MWETIVKAQSLESSNSNNNNNNENADPNSSNEIENNNNDIDINKNENKNSFQSVLSALNNISVSFTFIALLHLANEKKLQLVPKDENLADFLIKVKSFCFVDFF